jgi:hypothetical protein
MPGFTGIGWFDIGTDDPAAAGRFSGEVSGWTVAPEDAATGRNYRIVTTGDQEYAIFTLVVPDVGAACGRAEAAGGKARCRGSRSGRLTAAPALTSLSFRQELTP